MTPKQKWKQRKAERRAIFCAAYAWWLESPDPCERFVFRAVHLCSNAREKADLRPIPKPTPHNP